MKILDRSPAASDELIETTHPRVEAIALEPGGGNDESLKLSVDIRMSW